MPNCAARSIRVRIAFGSACEQPGASFTAGYLVHHDVLGFIAATRADLFQIPRTHKSDHLGAHAG